MSERTLQHWIVIGTSYRHVGFERLPSMILPPEDPQAHEALCGVCDADEMVFVSTWSFGLRLRKIAT